MGGCASKPKEFENRPNPAPADHDEAPASPKKAEQPEAEVQEKGNVGGENNVKDENPEAEAPLVDLSEPKKEAEESSSKTTTNDAETAVQQPKVTAEISENKVEAAVVGVEPTDKAKADKSADAPTAGKDAPLVTV